MTSRALVCAVAFLAVASVAQAQSGRSSSRSRSRTTNPPAAAPTPAPQPDPPAARAEPREDRAPTRAAAARAREDEGWLKTPARAGMFVEGGAMLGVAESRARPWFRGEIGFGLGASRLSLVVPIFFTNDHANVFGDRTNTMTYGLFPGLRYDMTLVNGHGDLSAWAEAGGGFLYAHTRADLLGTNGTVRDNDFRGGFRMALGATYIAKFGGMLTIQPAGMTMTWGQGGGRAMFEMALLLGYRWE